MSNFLRNDYVMIESQAPSQSQSQVWGFMNSQMKIEELSFFEELQINLNLQKLYFTVWIDEKLARFSTWQIFSTWRLFAKWKNLANWKNLPRVFRYIFYWCEWK